MNYSYVIGIILIGGGALFFLYSLLRGYIRPRAIRHYERIRDKLTLRKLDSKPIDLEGISHYEKIRDSLTLRETKEVEPEYSGGGFSLASLISSFIVILIGTSLIGPISEEVSKASVSSNITGTMSETMITMVPIFFAVAIGAIAIAVVVNSLRSSGLV